MATVATRLSWDGGLNFATAGSADFEPAVVAPPASVSAGERVSAAFAIDDVTIVGTQAFPEIRETSKPYQRHRVIVGGKDVTYFRDVQTPMPTYSLVSPLLYSVGQITFPQIHGVYERPGHGALTWLKKFAPVVVQRVDSEGGVIATDYHSFVSDFGHQGRTLTCSLGGQAEGRAAMQDRPIPIFPRSIDIGAQVIRTIRQRLHLPVGNEPDTGIVLSESGGGSQLDFLTDVLAKSTMRDGLQWTCMPNANNVYRVFQKDVETIGLTLYPDGYRVVPNLRRDFTEEPNRVWAEAIDDDGLRIRPSNLAGFTLELPPAFPGSMSPGDDGTDDFEKVRWQLWAETYLDGSPPPDVWTTADDDPVTQAIMDLQEDAGLTETGVVNAATWAALFDPQNNTGNVRGAAEKPAAQRSYTKEYLRSASGRILGRNPNWDPTRPPVDVSITDMGVVNGPRQLHRFARRELADDNVSNWVGTITVTTGAVIDGEHNPGDPLDASMIRDARSVKPGQNVWLPTWDGGTLVHISGVNVTADSVELTVDTRARDTMKVWEVISRNRESRKNPSRQWIAQNRRSGLRDNTGAWYDAGAFGRIRPTALAADVYTLVKVAAGRQGMLQEVFFRMRDDEAVFSVVALGEYATPDYLERHIGDLLTQDGQDKLEANQDMLFENKFLVGAWGTPEQPCGYYPRKHTGASGVTDAPITGDFRDRSGLPYFCHGGPWLYFAFRPDRDTTLQGGQIAKLLTDDTAG